MINPGRNFYTLRLKDAMQFSLLRSLSLRRLYFEFLFKTKLFIYLYISVFIEYFTTKYSVTLSLSFNVYFSGHFCSIVGFGIAEMLSLFAGCTHNWHIKLYIGFWTLQRCPLLFEDRATSLWAEKHDDSDINDGKGNDNDTDNDDNKMQQNFFKAGAVQTHLPTYQCRLTGCTIQRRAKSQQQNNHMV